MVGKLHDMVEGCSSKKRDLLVLILLPMSMEILARNSNPMGLNFPIYNTFPTL